MQPTTSRMCVSSVMLSARLVGALAHAGVRGRLHRVAGARAARSRCRDNTSRRARRRGRARSSPCPSPAGCGDGKASGPTFAPQLLFPQGCGRWGDSAPQRRRRRAQRRAGAQRAHLDAVPVAHAWQRARARAASSRRSASAGSSTKASISAAMATSQARAVLPSSTLIATPSPASGSAAQYTPSAPTLQNTRSPSACITRVSKRPLPPTMNGARAAARRKRAAAAARPGVRPLPLAARAKPCASWRSGMA